MERERLARPLDRGVPPLTLPSPREAVARVRARGVVGSARGAARLAARELRGAARRRRLARRPLAVGPGELERALGAPPGAILGGRVLAAMPTVARWERALERGDVDRRRLLERADAVAAHRFDLLGSGPTHLGGEIDWQLDFKAGRRWPLVHISRVPVAYADGSDIKVPWELSRCQHLPLLAAAAHVEPDGPYLRELGAQLTSWIDANPVEFGTNWLIAMEPAIRAANWIAALALVRDLGHAEPWFTRTLESLLLHGRFVRTHLEDGPVRGNHFLSNVVGLLVLAALFADGEDGREWREWGVPALERELFHQVRADGVAHEASIPYHRLVAELFVCGTHAADALAPGRLSSAYRERLSSMLDFTRDVTRGDGLAPLIGDSDDGRFLPLDTYGDDPRSHLHLFHQFERAYEPATTSAAYAAGGFYVLRQGAGYVAVRCGDNGAGGLGWHAHNDQLSFELAYGDTPLVVDPGSYVYTADPAARNRFRSTRAHATVAVDGGEQNELSEVELFRLRDRTRAAAIESTPSAFEGEHRGFPPRWRVSHRRRLELAREGRLLTVRDTVAGAGGRLLEWSFPLGGGDARAVAGGVDATIGGLRLELRGDDLDWSVERGEYAPRYGVAIEVPVVRARRRAARDQETAVVTLAVVPARESTNAASTAAAR